MPDPVTGPSEVVVAIAAASVNALGVTLRERAFKLVLPCSMPLVLGQDAAGTVISVGPATRRFRVGDELRQRREERLALLRREHRRRLVEDQELGVAHQRLQDFVTLALADRQPRDERDRVVSLWTFLG